jgi:hypothetical protein
MGLILLAASLAKADGIESYKDEPTSYRYSNRPTAQRSRPSIHDYVTAEQKRILKRIHADASRRMAEGRPIRRSRIAEPSYDRKPRRLAYAEPREPVRYAERRRGRHYSDGEPTSSLRRNDRECKPVIRVTGSERGLRWRAEENARKTWGRAAIDNWGYAYGSLDSAVGDNMSCTFIRTDPITRIPVYICRVSARPCRGI